MPTCGNCQQHGQSIEHIKSCYAAKTVVPAATDYAPMVLATVIPDSKYCIEQGGQLKFYEIRTGKGKWAGFQFTDMLIGHPGSWMKYPVKGEAKKILMATIGQDAKAAAIRFSKKFTVCAACGSPLSDPESLSLGLGPVCAEKF